MDLPYREVWAVDFEFIANPGDRPVPVCMVARELRTWRLLRVWQDKLGPAVPFPAGPETLFVAYNTVAELSCFLQLGWPVPARILDLYVEFRAVSGGIRPPAGWGLLSALSSYGIQGITSDEKHAGRDLVMRGGPWASAERREILDYCQTDVDCLGPLLDRMLPRITSTPRGLGQALLRGRYMAAVARMEHAGVPIDTVTLTSLRKNWDSIKTRLISQVDARYGVYDGTTFKLDRFERWLARESIPWPLTDKGQLKTDQDTFKDLALTYPQLGPLRELRHTLSDLKLERLAVGSDGRNRVSLFPFGARTSRNTPSANGFIFGPAKWLRGLIKPAEDRAVAYIDYRFQEVAIAAALSGDPALLDAVASGDPYLAFARRAGLVPAGATKATHERERDMCKTCVLGVNYGMQAGSLAGRLGTARPYAEHLLRLLARTFPVFWEWSQAVVDSAMLTGRITSAFGWTQYVIDSTRPTALKNYPMQANGAEMLRIASCLATERGVTVCAPIHDALLIEAGTEDAGSMIKITQEAMSDASAAVLDGMELESEPEVVSWPARYSDKRGQVMWDLVTSLLAEECQ
jgi:DNA polymerase I